MLVEMSNSPDVLLIARVVHEAIRAYQIALGEDPAPAWDEAEDWQRQTTVAGVNYRLANPQATAAELHNLWAEELRKLGWRLGPARDARAKTHPSLVDFGTLSANEKRKDELFGAIVSAFAGAD